MQTRHFVLLLLLLTLPVAALIALPAAARSNSAPGDGKITIFLKNGHMLSGDVLKERPDATVIDLGFKGGVVEVPASEIQRRAIGQSDPSAIVEAPGNGFYVEGSANAAERSVKDLTEELCESVALVSTPGGLGSGFAIDNKGHFVTNFHVVQGEQDISLTLFKRAGEALERIKLDKVRIVAVNPYIDLALVQAQFDGKFAIRPLPIAASANIHDGQNVFAIGNPLGLERTISEGIISNTRRDFEGQLYLQTTAPINPGNSGGPLFNMKGEVVGVTNMKAGLFTEGLSFAIPVATLKFFLSNRDAFVFDKDNPNSGFHYFAPPRKSTVTAVNGQVDKK